jgi:hypothetical protein
MSNSSVFDPNVFDPKTVDEETAGFNAAIEKAMAAAPPIHTLKFFVGWVERSETQQF